MIRLRLNPLSLWERARPAPVLTPDLVRGVQDAEGVGGTKRLRLSAVVAALAFVGLAATACFQQSNTYPVEVFKEMHYAQFNRSQEPPRLPPQAGVVVFQGSGGTEAVLNVPAKQERPYNPGNPADVARAAELFRVNCSVCHGQTGRGDGPNAPHLTSKNSYFATKNGAPYPPPANLQQSLTRPDFTPDVAYSTVSRGVVVMPRFGALLPEQDIRDIVNYLFDKQNGIASKGP